MKKVRLRINVWKILLLIAIIGFPFFNYATESVPSRTLPNNLKERIKVDALNEYAAAIKDTSRNLAYSLALQAFNISKAIHYNRGKADSYLIFARYFRDEHDFLSSLKLVLIVLDISEQINYKKGQILALEGIGGIYSYLKRADKAKQYFNEALFNACKVHDTISSIKFLINIADVEMDEKHYDSAKIKLFYSLYLSERIKNIRNKAFVYKNIGKLYYYKQDYQTALYYSKISVDHFSSISDRIQLGSIYTFIGHLFELTKDQKNALAYNKMALLMRVSTKSTELVSSSCLNVGQAFLLLNKLDSASIYLNRGIELAESQNKTYLLVNGYKYLSQLYVLKKKYLDAFSFLKKYSIINESVNSEKYKQDISILLANRNIAEQEREKTILKNEIYIQKLISNNRLLLIFLFVLLSFVLALLAIFIFRLFLQKKKEKQLVEEINYQLQDEIKEKEIENEELSKSERHFRFLADNAADPIILLDNTFKCLYVSPFSELVFGYSPAELIELKDFREVIHPKSQRDFEREYKAMIEYGDSSRIVYQVIKKDGSLFWAESTINPIFDESTKDLKAMISISRDVSIKIDQEETMMFVASQKETLIKEVHHRVKNNLAILASIVSMQQRQFSDIKTVNVLADLQFRVKAMALVHEQLYKNVDIKDLPIRGYLSNLINIVESSFGKKKITVHQDIDDEILEVETMLSLGLIVNELLTNAFKYAFPDNRRGNIWVIYKNDHHHNKFEYPVRCLTVKDDGIGLPYDFTLSDRKSMGSQIIDLLSQKLEGEIEIDGTRGASFSLTLPTIR